MLEDSVFYFMLHSLKKIQLIGMLKSDEGIWLSQASDISSYLLRKFNATFMSVHPHFGSELESYFYPYITP